MQDVHLKLRLADEVDQSLGNCGLVGDPHGLVSK